MNLMKLKKTMAHHLRYLLLFGEQQKNTTLKKFLQKKRRLKNVKIN